MVQKIIEVVGISKESFAKAAEDAIENAGKTVRDIKWGRAQEFEVRVEKNEIVEYRTLMRIYFDVEGRE